MFYRVNKLFVADIRKVKRGRDNTIILVDDVPLKKVIIERINSGIYPKAKDFRGNTYEYFYDCGFNYEEKIGQIMISHEISLSYFVKEDWLKRSVIIGIEEGLANRNNLGKERSTLQAIENILSLELQILEQANLKREVDLIIKSLMELVEKSKTLPDGKRQLEFSNIAKLGYAYIDAMLAIANNTADVTPETVINNALNQIEIIKSRIEEKKVIPFIRIRSDNNDRK